MTDTKEPTTPEQARFLAASLIRAGIEGLPTALRSLADQLEAVTEARDNAVQSAKYTADLCTQALADLKLMTAELGDLPESQADMLREIKQLKGERDVLKLDAERYRFWRNRYPVTFSPTDMTPEDVDKATDAAIAKEKTT